MERIHESAEDLMAEITELLVQKACDIATSGDSKHSLSGLLATEEVLQTLLDRTERNIKLKETYDEKCRRHNQNGLFNLLKTLTDFEIDDEKFKQLTFRELLLVSKVHDASEYHLPAPVGGICIDIETIEGGQPFAMEMEEYETRLMKILDEHGQMDHVYGGSGVDLPSAEAVGDGPENSHGYHKFLVHVYSQFEVGERNAGSSITSWVDKNLHTLEELRKEFLVEEDIVNEKTLYTALKKQWYYVKHTSSVEDIDDRKLYSIKKAKHYMSEGASFILMRYLALTKYLGKFELSCCYINGDMCRNIYECFGPQGSIINSKRLDICRIKRTIIEECGIQHVSMSVLTLQGQLLKQEWEDCDYILHVNPRANLKNEQPGCLTDILISDSWETDMQMMSKYIDEKGIALLKNKTYMVDHPELKDILSDYVNTILQLRPTDVYQYTFSHFKALWHPTYPRNEYFE